MQIVAKEPNSVLTDTRLRSSAAARQWA